MPLPPSQASVCEQCGHPLAAGNAVLGCLHCLLGGIGEHIATSSLRDAPQPPSTDGAARFHHYEILRREDGTPFELGRGGMGVTYKAMDVNLRVPVALKVIDAGYATRPRARDLFQREARSAARLRHPNVATVYHFGTREPDPATAGSLVDEDPAGTTCFYAMEFVDGETLDARVRRLGPLPPGEVLEIALQIARALVAAEERGIVHRDLKPANVMLADHAATAGRERAWVKVIDFGLAKAMSAAVSDGSAFAPATAGPVTHGAFVGTPGFASPEQFERAELDVRSDVYSLGVTLWFALTGHLPHEGDTLAEVHDRQVHRPLPVAQLSDVCTPPPLIELLTKMLAPDPARRPASARALCEAVETCLAVVQGEPQRYRHRLAMAVTALVLLGGAAALAAALHPWARTVAIAPPAAAPTKPATPAVPEKSLAVLPFEDLSADKDNTFLTDGVQDEVLTDLAKVADVKVISRSSVMQYKAGAPRDLREIATQLAVAYVVEGSVQHAGNRVRVNARLIDARTGAQQWAEHYDRSLEDVFGLQSDIAEAITHRLQARLSPEEKSAIEAPTTADLQAYGLYRRAKSLVVNQTADNDHRVFLEAVGLLEEAVARDPKYLQAWCLLEYAHDYLYSQHLDFTPARLELAARAAQQALSVAPDSGEAHLAFANHYYMSLRDYPHALAEVELARRTLPNNAKVYAIAGAVKRRQARWEEAEQDLLRAMALDPRDDEDVYQSLIAIYRNLRRYDDEARILDRALVFDPGSMYGRVQRAEVDIQARADTKPYQKVLAAALAAEPNGDYVYPWYALCERTPAAAALVMANNPHEGSTNMGTMYPYAYLDGLIARWQGDAAHARTAFTTARKEVAKTVAAHPDSSGDLSLLGLIDAGLGNKADAIAEGRHACELLPVTADAVQGPIRILNLALIYAWVGEKAAAVEQLEALRNIPCIDYNYGLLKLCPIWDDLRGYPAFEELLVSLGPKAGH